jgi:hypothetical protein
MMTPVFDKASGESTLSVELWKSPTYGMAISSHRNIMTVDFPLISPGYQHELRPWKD